MEEEVPPASIIWKMVDNNDNDYGVRKQQLRRLFMLICSWETCIVEDTLVEFAFNLICVEFDHDILSCNLFAGPTDFCAYID